ncbi:MAG: ABC transporter permease, partial [Verrucomicrobiota bacterium]
AASGQAQDFGQLFLGFSFFLIVAALLLMSLLFLFGIERRAVEIGTYLALGFTSGQVRRLLIAEGVALAAIGSIAGIPGGILYARGMLYGLSTIWRDAVGTSALTYHASAATLGIGLVSGLAVASVTIWIALRKQARQPARELLSQGAELERAVSRKPSRGIWVGWLASAGAILLIGWAGFQHQAANAEVFFLAGTLLLVSGLGFAAACLGALASSGTASRPSLGAMGLRNAARRRRRSLATMGLLACGSFLVAAIGVFKLDTSDRLRNRSSGTGGFALLGESSFPIVQDLNTESARQFFGFSESDLAGVRFVSCRVRDGEDASCLNLNRAQQPTLLGLRPQSLHERGAFTFAQVAAGHDPTSPWLLLNQPEPDGAIPAIGDAASIQWALGKKLGDVLAYTDERGRTFQVRLVAAVANSILQGSLVIAESQFQARFPSESGYRAFFIDVSPYATDRIEAVAATLSRAAQDYGLQLVRTSRRLEALNAVQNTYLNTFQVLGGLGLLLGSVGLAVVVLRNVLERRSELGLLLAVGLRTRSLSWLVVSEHGALLLIGLGIGILAALVAVVPSALTPGAEIPVQSLLTTLAVVFGSGAVWTWIAAKLALRGRLLDALRND